MKKLFKGLMLFAIAIILTSTINAQEQSNVLGITTQLKLDGIQSEVNVFNIIITDDENNEFAFSAKESFTCDLNLDHSYTIIIKSNNYTSQFIVIDANGAIKTPQVYDIQANLNKYPSADNTIKVDYVEYSKDLDKFIKTSKN